MFTYLNNAFILTFNISLAVIFFLLYILPLGSDFLLKVSENGSRFFRACAVKRKNITVLDSITTTKCPPFFSFSFKLKVKKALYVPKPWPFIDMAILPLGNLSELRLDGKKLTSERG